LGDSRRGRGGGPPTGTGGLPARRGGGLLGRGVHRSRGAGLSHFGRSFAITETRSPEEVCGFPVSMGSPLKPPCLIMAASDFVAVPRASGGTCVRDVAQGHPGDRRGAVRSGL